MDNSLRSANRPGFAPCPEQTEILQTLISGNLLNRRGEAENRRPFPIYWQAAEDMPHGRLMLWYYTRPVSEVAATARKLMREANAQPSAPRAPTRLEDTPERSTAMIKNAALGLGAGQVGIARLRPDWVFEGHEVNPNYRWMIVLAVQMDFEKIKGAPDDSTQCEVIDQYARGTRIATALASWIRLHGWDAEGHCGASAGHVLLIPHAIEAGLGELGKHGSMISREFGASFRLAGVMTDMPLLADAPAPFGADDFCLNCQVCANRCPPGAIADAKQLVNGTIKWYVDFDHCVPYFHEYKTCAICLAVCPWSAPGRAPRLAERFSRRAAERTAKSVRLDQSVVQIRPGPA
jgi:Pyruvate/2-oxoacid:ferredoxin oxidoreductase delta subunit